MNKIDMALEVVNSCKNISREIRCRNAWRALGLNLTAGSQITDLEIVLLEMKEFSKRIKED